jgi:1-acyl-sn-glycerol-3-phosphate acyltransferase
VLKRELLWVPILGWILMLLKPIAIDRKGRSVAVQQVLAQGRERLAEGLWVAVFPEGTRMPLGATRRYGLSGALLAAANGRTVVPVAHNAAEFWPRRGFLKRPGTIRVVVGAPLTVSEHEPRAVMDDVHAWIEAKVAELTGLPVAVPPKPAARNGGERAVAKP